MITRIFRKFALERVKLRLLRVYFKSKLLKFHILRFFLGLKIVVLSFQCFVLGLHKQQMLANDSRRAVFVDEAFKKIKHDLSQNNYTRWPVEKT